MALIKPYPTAMRRRRGGGHELLVAPRLAQAHPKSRQGKGREQPPQLQSFCACGVATPT